MPKMLENSEYEKNLVGDALVLKSSE